MSTLERAIEIAAVGHAGHRDNANQSYVLHALRVMLRVDGEAVRIAGVLHDVVEDTPLTLAQLSAEDFSSRVIDAVDSLTKRPGESRRVAAERAVLDPIARVVKLADHAENMDLSRIPEPTDKDRARIQKYAAVREFLRAHRFDSNPPEP